MAAKIHKVPPLLQMENVECGAACLGMILAYHKKFIPLEKLRVDCGVSRDGSSAKNIVLAAGNYGLEAKAYRFEPEELNDTSLLPAIIHWNFNHFVVLKGFSRNRAHINDPALGPRSVDMEEFDRAFTGIALFFSKQADFEEQGKPARASSFLLKQLKGFGPAVAFLILSGVVSTAAAAMLPLFSRLFTDYVLFGRSPQWFPYLQLSMGGAMVLLFACRAMQAHFLLKIRVRMAACASAGFMNHLLKLPLEFYAQRFTGDLCDRQDSNEELAGFLCLRLIPIMQQGLLIVVFGGALLFLNTGMALVGMGAAAASLLLSLAVSRAGRDTARTLLRDGAKLWGTTLAGIELIETLKACGAEDGYAELRAGNVTRLANTRSQWHRKNILLKLPVRLLQDVLNTSVLILGVYAILRGEFTIGALLSFQGFLSQFMEPLNDWSSLVPQMQEARGRTERLEDVLNNPVEELFAREAPGFSKLTGELEVKNLTFGYSPLSPPLFEGLSFHVEKGGTVALVGGSGSGKSTLAQLIAGLRKPASGEILFDGKPRQAIDPGVFAGSVAMVEQKSVFFPDTVRNNITLWDGLADEKAVIKGMKEACIHEDILLRPKGYEHEISEGGGNFSGGQLQRLDIGAALAREPSLLILDEATSALDPATEKEIMEAIKARGMTVLVIAHRLSAIRDANRILFLENGRVVEEGSHRELLALGGKYAQLIQAE